MNKRMNWLVLVPAWGTIILYFWLFKEMRQGFINSKKLIIFFFLSGLVGMVSTLLFVFSLIYLSNLIDISAILSAIGPNFMSIIMGIFNGYIVNIFTFILVNVKWDDLENTF